MNSTDYQVAIIGAGPSGLATAIQLKQLGVADVVVIERESVAGGIPRHCGHSPFGLREFHRVLSGPGYTSKLTNQTLSLGAKIYLDTTVAKIEPGGKLTLSTLEGQHSLIANKVVICTGNREAPRSSRLVSGSRPMGVMTTGALQSMVYLKQRRPFSSPVIIGSETVSFSALLSCRQAGIKPVAMIESGAEITAARAAKWLPRLLRVRLLTNTELHSIQGQAQVESISVSGSTGVIEQIKCDGVIFSGNFVSEASLGKMGHLSIDGRSGGPVVDQYNRCSDPTYFACGNILHPVDTAGWCWAEGKRVAGYVDAGLNDQLPSVDKQLVIQCDDSQIKYFTPQRVSVSAQNRGCCEPNIQIRVAHNVSGTLSLKGDAELLTQKQANYKREKRILLPLPPSVELAKQQMLTLQLES